jgi:1,4-dihydroxy-6-naphthoate synthase
MDEQVMRQHIDLYVNNYSLTLGEDGQKAVETLLQTYERIHQRVETSSL